MKNLSTAITFLVKEEKSIELNAKVIDEPTKIVVKFYGVKGLRRDRVLNQLELHYGFVDSVETFKYTAGDYDWVFTFLKKS